MNWLRVTEGAEAEAGFSLSGLTGTNCVELFRGLQNHPPLRSLPTPPPKPSARSLPDPQLIGEAVAQPLNPGHMDQSRLGNQTIA